MGPNGSKLGHWRHTLEGDIRTLAPSSFSLLLPHHHQAHRLPLPYAFAMIYIAALGPKQQTQSEYGLKPLQL
jgi:hypothetical protein